MLLGKRSLSFFVRVPFRAEGYIQLELEVYCFHNRYFHEAPAPGGGTLGISGWGCAAGTLEPLTYTRASSAEFCYPILE